MKLPIPSSDEIYRAAHRAEEAIYKSGSRAANVYIIENAIQHVLRMFIDRMNIQMPDPLQVDLRKD